MAVIKYDVSGVDPERALMNFEPPKPGVYRAKVAEINPGFSKGDDGKPDKTRPRLEVIYAITQPGDFLGSRVWDYVTFGEDAKWKLDQFLQAMGETNAKKRKGQFNTDTMIDKPVRIRVRGDTNNNGEYQAKVGQIMRPAAGGEVPEGSDEDPFGGGDDENPFDDDGDAEDLDTGEETGDEGTDDDGYDDMPIPELRKELTARGLDAKGGKPALIARLRENDAEAEGEEGGEEEPPDDGYDDMSIADLRKELRARGLEVKGAQAALIARLRENDAEEEPF